MRSCVIQSKTHQLIAVRSSGPVSFTDWQDLIHVVMSLDFYELGVPILHDMQSVDFAAEVRDMIGTGRTHVRPSQPSVSRKVAMVASNELGVGMIGIVARLRRRPEHLTEGFRSFEAAASWLARPDLSNGFPPAVEARISNLLEESLNPGSKSVLVAKDFN